MCIKFNQKLCVFGFWLNANVFITLTFQMFFVLIVESDKLSKSLHHPLESINT